MTLAGALHHAKDQINVNCVAHSVVATGMVRSYFESEDIIGLMKRATPWPWLGSVEDTAGAVALTAGLFFQSAMDAGF
ncbi:hypothetical protein jhhlp_007889 [Lomentospora prolificans]|uniref:Uncharacterized protein n=1 Tax=Lomentospora prolificans TaxID=41688 RepID=A0A2N3N0V9_9PEZI|nr:hypothetical protein jhhlp_007889 [Lomentospora prolificans]